MRVVVSSILNIRITHLQTFIDSDQRTYLFLIFGPGKSKTFVRLRNVFVIAKLRFTQVAVDGKFPLLRHNSPRELPVNEASRLQP